MVFESFIDHVEGIKYKFSGNMVVSKFTKSRCQDSINVRYPSEIRSSVRSCCSLVRGFSEDGGIFSHIWLSRRLRVWQRSASTIFTPQTALVSVAGFRSMGLLDILISIPYIYMMDCINKISNNIPWIVSRLRFPAISVQCLYRIVNSKSPLCPKYIYRITS